MERAGGTEPLRAGRGRAGRYACPMTIAAIRPDLPPPEPERPDEQACCGNGCEPCVFDLYAEARRRWREEMKAWQQRQAGGSPDAAPMPAA